MTCPLLHLSCPCRFLLPNILFLFACPFLFDTVHLDFCPHSHTEISLISLPKAFHMPTMITLLFLLILLINFSVNLQHKTKLCHLIKEFFLFSSILFIYLLQHLNLLNKIILSNVFSGVTNNCVAACFIHMFNLNSL